MAREPQRAPEPHHLDAKLIPVERALLARANAIEDRVAHAENPVIKMDPAEAAVLSSVAAEFRALAAELHHW